MRWDSQDDEVPVPGRERTAYLRVVAVDAGCRVEVHQLAATDDEAAELAALWRTVLARLRTTSPRPSPPPDPRHGRSAFIRSTPQPGHHGQRDVGDHLHLGHRHRRALLHHLGRHLPPPGLHHLTHPGDGAGPGPFGALRRVVKPGRTDQRLPEPYKSVQRWWKTSDSLGSRPWRPPQLSP